MAERNHHWPIGKTVHTPEGIAGKITGHALGGDPEDPLYEVEWEDGIEDEQPESLFQESDDIPDDGDDD